MSKNEAFQIDRPRTQPAMVQLWLPRLFSAICHTVLFRHNDAIKPCPTTTIFITIMGKYSLEEITKAQNPPTGINFEDAPSSSSALDAALGSSQETPFFLATALSHMKDGTFLFVTLCRVHCVSTHESDYSFAPSLSCLHFFFTSSRNDPAGSKKGLSRGRSPRAKINQGGKWSSQISTLRRLQSVDKCGKFSTLLGRTKKMVQV